ncbi:MAG: hypothetical protein DBX47_02340 [Clostridiales bacterium]|nr:MAG: hypothetical protein DBX47_02340 [Clostridiales bacterium]
MFISFKAELNEIQVLPFGISVKLQSSALSYKKEILAALAGPTANGLIAFLFSFLSEANVIGIRFFILCNIALAAVNMLPIFPLDGGRALYFHLCDVKNPFVAKQFSLWVSIILLIPLFAASVWLLCITGYNFSLLIIVFYLLFYLVSKKY